MRIVVYDLSLRRSDVFQANTNNMAEDDEPSDGRRVSLGSRLTPQTHSRSRFSQVQAANRASPLVSFSKSLQGARKNADALVVSAQNNEHVKKFKDNLEDFEHKLKLQAQEATAKLNSLKAQTSQNAIVTQDWHFPLAAGPRQPSGMRKSYSATDFSKFSQLLQSDSKVSIDCTTSKLSSSWPSPVGRGGEDWHRVSDVRDTVAGTSTCSCRSWQTA